MTRDELAAILLKIGAVKVDLETGDVFVTRGGHGCSLAAPKKVGCFSDKGYLVASFRFNGKRKQIRLNRLVWIAKHGRPDEDLDVCHKNNDKADNRPCNLYLATGARNMADAARDGLMPTYERNAASKLSRAQRRAVYDAYHRGEGSTYVLAPRFRISKSRVQQIVTAPRP